MPDPKKKPIVVNDPNDPRLHKYLDSLNLYKGYELSKIYNKQDENSKLVPKTLPKNKIKYSKSDADPHKSYSDYLKYSKEFEKKLDEEFRKDPKNALNNIKKIPYFNTKKAKMTAFSKKEDLTKYDKNAANLVNEYEKLNFKDPVETGYWKTPDLYDPNIQEIGSYYKGAYNPIFKKPNQEIKYIGNFNDVLKLRHSPYIAGVNKIPNNNQKQIIIQKKETPQVTPLQKIQTKGLIETNQEINSPLATIRPQTQMPKYWNVTDTNNQRFGATETKYKIYPETLNTLRELPKEGWDRKITAQYAMGGNLQQNNMKNNNLTRFNEGGSHEQNPLGGVPQGQSQSGQMNTVEEGETKKKNYVYSDRLSIDENMTKQMNLPSYIKGKTFAAASKAIDNKFLDRNDNYSNETKNTLLDRLKQAQETIKQQEQQRAEQIAQSMQSNQQQVPDMMNGEIPEGMEEFTEQPEQNQMFMGGNFNLAEAGNITGGLSGLAGKASPYLGAASGAMSLGNLAQGNGASTNKAQSALSGVATGAQAGMAFGPWGAGIGAAVGLGAGLIGANKAQKQQAIDLRNNANSANLTDNFAYGGKIKMGDGGIPGVPNSSTRIQDPNYFKKDIVGSADYNTNVIQNLHNALGITPNTKGYGTAWGQKSNEAYFKKDLLDGNSSAINWNKEGVKSYGFTKEDVTGPGYEKMRVQLGLTPEGYKYLGPETPDTSMLKPTEQLFVEPTGVKQSMENYYQNSPNKINSENTDNTDNDKQSWLDKNGGKMLKYAPVAMNAFQLSQLKKPQYTRLDRLTDRFKPEYVDEQSLQNIANNEYNNSVNAVSQIGGSQGAVRNSIIGAGLNKTKALSDAYMNASAQNRQTNIAGQEFNLGVNKANLIQADQELDINDRNQAAYRNEKSKLLSSIGTDLGSIGKEEVNKNQIAEALGYDVNGDYVVNKKTGKKMLTKDFEEKVKNGTLNKKYNFGNADKFTNSSINYTPTNFKIGQ